MLKTEMKQPVVFVIAVVCHFNSVLLVKRKEPPYENMWSIPGGKVEWGETLQKAVERKVREETGIQVKAGSPINSFDMILEDDAGEIETHYVIVELEASHQGGDLKPNNEVLDAAWVSSRALISMEMDQDSRQLLIDQGFIRE